MSQLYASAAIGTAALMLAAILVLLRVNTQSHRLFVTLERRWVAASSLTSSLVLGLLAVIAIGCFSELRLGDESALHSALNPSVHVSSDYKSRDHANRPSGHPAALAPGEVSPDAQALASLRDYADTIGAKQPPPVVATPAPNAVDLPAVDTMIAKLAARLEQQPDDVRGWKMLGWSYLNMGLPAEAVKAYETALKLDSNDPEISKGLEQAKTAQTGPVPSAADNSKTADPAPGTGNDNMIRGMVDQLARRLETSPHDEDGWLRLMRSRMTLGEKDAAKTALTKALATFASDAAATGRLTSAARALGVESN